MNAASLALRRLGHYLADRRHAWQAPRAFSLDTLAHLAAGRRFCLERFRPATPGGASVDVALTFDVERDWGSATRARALTALEPFVRRVRPVLDRAGARATFLVEGGIVAEAPAPWAELARDGHEVGLHGYHHESWGLDWFNDLATSPLLDPTTADVLLFRAREAFARASLPPPRSFRAPNLVLDPRMLPVLFRHGIRVDSSAAAMKGERPLRRLLHASPKAPADALISVPPSTAVVPRVLRVGALPYFRYAVFTLQTVLALPPHALRAYAEDIVRYQLHRGHAPHLVFLAHPWEFVDPPADAPAGLGVLSAQNAERLERALAELGTALRMRFRTLAELGAQAATLGGTP